MLEHPYYEVQWTDVYHDICARETFSFKESAEKLCQQLESEPGKHRDVKLYRVDYHHNGRSPMEKMTLIERS